MGLYLAIKILNNREPDKLSEQYFTLLFEFFIGGF